MSYDEAIMIITLSQGGEPVSGHLFATYLGNGNLFPKADTLAFDDGISLTFIFFLLFLVCL